MAPDIRRMMSLTLTLTRWTPRPSQGLSVQGRCHGQDGLLTPNILDSRACKITSASPAPPVSTRPLTLAGTEIRRTSASVVAVQHATDRFPRFAYLLRHGTPQPESQSEHSRRSADPHSDSGWTHASVATIPDARAQCGGSDETALQSCAAASASGTLGHVSPARRSSPSRDTSSTSATPVLSEPPAFKSVSEDLHNPDPAPCTVAMANYTSAATSSSQGGSRTEQLQVSTRRGTDRIGNERITGETQLSFSPSHSKHQSQASTDYEDVDEDDHDQTAQDTDSHSQAGAQAQAEGQPRKKKTRRAGAAITRVRRMQREVRRLAEEEEANVQRQPQPVRVRPRVPFIELWHGRSLACL